MQSTRSACAYALFAQHGAFTGPFLPSATWFCSLRLLRHLATIPLLSTLQARSFVSILAIVLLSRFRLCTAESVALFGSDHRDDQQHRCPLPVRGRRVHRHCRNSTAEPRDHAAQLHIRRGRRCVLQQSQTLLLDSNRPCRRPLPGVRGPSVSMAAETSNSRFRTIGVGRG